MATIVKPNTFSPNTTISSSEMNTNFDTLYNEFNGSISDANLASNAVTTAKITDLAVTTAKINTDAVTSTKLADDAVVPANLTAGTGTTWVQASWSPTLSGLFADAKWNKTGAYIQIGKLVFFELRLVANTTTPMSGAGAATFTLPVTAKTFTSGDASTRQVGAGAIYDSGTSAYVAYPSLASDTLGVIRSTISANMTSTSPMTWTTNDEIFINGFYEAA